MSLLSRGEVYLGEATGNRFLVLDRRRDSTPEFRARALEERAAPAVCRALEVDGLLTLAAARAGADLRMVLHNRDGGRAEACGNGLRILACLWRELGGQAARGATCFLIETDAGARTGWPLLDPDGRVRRVRVSLGVPRLWAVDERLGTPSGEVLAHLVDVGNPHCVVFVADLERVDVARLGAALEHHPRFPAGSNVEFVERTAEGLRCVIWERGVGETASCGSGVVAAAWVARQVHGVKESLRVETRGGILRVTFAADGEAHLEGPATIWAVGTHERQRLISLDLGIPEHPVPNPPTTPSQTP